VQFVAEGLHSGDEGSAAVKLARNEIGAVVLYGDQVRAIGEWSAINEDVSRRNVQGSENFVKGLLEIVERARSDEDVGTARCG
jgi:hypothetical protein